MKRLQRRCPEDLQLYSALVKESARLFHYMKCLHPSCPLSQNPMTWAQVLDEVKCRTQEKAAVLTNLNASFTVLGVAAPPPTPNGALLGRLLSACPCLFTQVDKTATASAIVHLTEVTLGRQITSANVNEAFAIQNPTIATPTFRIKPIKVSTDKGGVGPISEAFCSEVLTNHGVPAMTLSAGYPIWQVPGHVRLNTGVLPKKGINSFGDILIPAIPLNIFISCKSVTARERLLVSANRIESVGFGFFNDPAEFWAPGKSKIYKRFGFTAIYMPDDTALQVMDRLRLQGRTGEAVNINNTIMFRPLSSFGPDMLRIVGKITLDL